MSVYGDMWGVSCLYIVTCGVSCLYIVTCGGVMFVYGDMLGCYVCIL